jgi:hypothetical protein
MRHRIKHYSLLSSVTTYIRQDAGARKICRNEAESEMGVAGP